VINRVANKPLRKPNPKDLPTSTFSLELLIFLSSRIEIAAAAGIIRQQLKFLIPGTVESTEAPNPQTSVGKYFLKIINLFLLCEK
jgi:hypothetical protein